MAKALCSGQGGALNAEASMDGHWASNQVRGALGAVGDKSAVKWGGMPG